MLEKEFRVWDKEKKIMEYFDFLSLQFDSSYNEDYPTNDVIKVKDIILCAQGMNNPDIELMQYIGIEDIESKKIFKDDIVEFTQLGYLDKNFEKIGGRIHIGTIEWVNYSGCMGFIYRGKDKRVYFLINRNLILNHKIKVIGNKWENSNLLLNKK